MNALIVLGHGSRLVGGARDMLRVARELAERLPGVTVQVAYQELCEPSLEQAAERLVGDGARRIAVLPYFLHRGRHVATELPERIRVLAAKHPDTEWSFAEHLGYDPRLVEMLLDRALTLGLRHG